MKLTTPTAAVTHHLLASLYAQLEAVHGSLQPIGSVAEAGAAGGYGAPAGTGFGAHAGAAGGGYGGYGSSPLPVSAVSAAASSVDAKNEAVMNAFRAEGDVSEDGASIDMVVNRLRGQGISRPEVERIVEYLTMEGFIYSTIDETHFKATS